MALITFLTVSLAVVSSVYSITPEEKMKFEEALKPALDECGAKYGVTLEDIKKAHESGNDDAIDPCMAGCVYKKIGVINDDGFYVADKSEEDIKNMLSNQDDIDKLNLVVAECSKINEESVTDGKEGCQRAKLLNNCFKNHKELFLRSI